ncbi:MAG: exodeoxyribonuclease V subunit gamma [SAR324 cluster bacterium]|nr:exodeoxyribonuclease V subunit gamma [SAR324 cluster bacterium]
MPGFFLHSGNRQEILLKELAKVVNKPLQQALQAEYIVVQNHGMQRWISMRLAEENGIEANSRFLFPNELLQQAFAQGIPGYNAMEPLEQDHLAWTLFEILQNRKEDFQFEPLSRYLSKNRPFKAWQLSKRIANLFDQYGVFRPEMIMKWNAGESDDWQAELWRKIPQRLQLGGKPFLRKSFLDHVEDSFRKTNRFPERISVFGISSLPPLHVEVLEVLSRHTDIHFFFLSAAENHWGAGRENGSGQETEQDLLSSLGKTGKDFFLLLKDRGLLQQQENLRDFDENCFVYSSADSLLEKVQDNLLKPVLPAPGNKTEKKSCQPDGSIQIHSCHSRMREVEVLYDQLLYLMDHDPELKPDDILVMTPQIEEYVPFIQSVFSDETADSAFPYSITDRSSRGESEVVQYIIRMLKMLRSRFCATEVLDILESEAIRLRFQLNSSDVELIHNWIAASNIRWGIDESFREELNFPRTRENTWQFGIDRILSGYAMPGKGKILFKEVLPFDEIEGNDALVFGRFLMFFEHLSALVGDGKDSLKENRTLKEWSEFLRQLLRKFFKNSEKWDSEMNLIWQMGEDLEKIEETVQQEMRVDIEVLVSYLEEKLDQAMKKIGFLGFGTTFCSMLPMRSIPFKVIALLGMNQSAFPRNISPLSFDLMIQNKELGDRSIKEEDRYLFLETIICCRKVLYISYIGQEIRDNTSLPPSSLITELIENIENNFDLQKEQMLTKHHLQAFNPAYFQKESSLFSYSKDNWHAAAKLSNQEQRAVHRFEIQLPDPIQEAESVRGSETDSGKSWLDVDIDQLVRFFSNPAQFLLSQRIGVHLQNFEDLPDDDEPFFIDALKKYSIQTEQLNYIFEGQRPDFLKNIAKARGELPLGHAGQISWDEISNETYQFANAISEFLSTDHLEPVEYDLQFEAVNLRGTISDIRVRGLVRYRPALVKIKDRIRVWLEHLVLSLYSNSPLETVLIGKGTGKKKMEQYICESIDSPQHYLSELLILYKKGLRKPLAFFPDSANAYMKEWVKGKQDRAREKARETWYGGDRPGEMEKNLYFKRCFEALDLIEETDFEQDTLAILEPIFTHQKQK